MNYHIIDQHGTLIASFLIESDADICLEALRWKDLNPGAYREDFTDDRDLSAKNTFE